MYNAAEMDIQAVDRSFGISKIDVRINGAPLADAAARGCAVLGAWPAGNCAKPFLSS